MELQVQTESLSWLGQTVTEFGLKIAVKPYVEFARSCLVRIFMINSGFCSYLLFQGAMQQPVRQAAINFLGVLRIYVGPSLLSLLEDEKPALVTTIKEKFTEVCLDVFLPFVGLNPLFQGRISKATYTDQVRKGWKAESGSGSNWFCSVRKDLCSCRRGRRGQPR